PSHRSGEVRSEGAEAESGSQQTRRRSSDCFPHRFSIGLVSKSANHLSSTKQFCPFSLFDSHTFLGVLSSPPAPGLPGSTRRGASSGFAFVPSPGPLLRSASSVAAKDPSLAKVPLATMKAKELLWELFTSDKESKSYSKLVDYMKGEDSVTEVDVPGCDPNQRHLKSTDLAKLLALRILQWFSWLHSAGWSFNGEISSDDIFLTPLGHAKVKKGRMKLLKRCKVKRRAKDMNAVANVIQDGIFKSGDIPYDIQHLLWLLRHFRSYYADLLLNHSSLLNESANLFLIRCIPQRLRQLSKLDPAKYRRIISKVPY
ncbi:unnamed protein product, partial [Urochloa humidicola]